MFTTKYKVRFYDTDSAGILFYANIFKIAHAAYEEFMQLLQLKRNYFNDNEIVLPIIHAEAKFKSPVKHNDELIVDIKVSEVKNSSFALTYIIKSNSNQVNASVNTVHVAVDKQTFEKAELPQELRAALNSHRA